MTAYVFYLGRKPSLKLPSRLFYITLQRNWEWTDVHSGLQLSLHLLVSEGVQLP